MQLIDLINAASKAAGSDANLVRQLGIKPPNLSGWRSGARDCGVEYRALMAFIAGLNVDEVIHDALIQKHANKPLGEKLLSALGNAVHGVAATMLAFVSAACFVTPGRVEASPTLKPTHDNVYYVNYVMPLRRTNWSARRLAI